MNSSSLDVEQPASSPELVCRSVQLRIEFRFLPKAVWYWNVLCRNDRLFLSKHGRAVALKFLLTFGLNNEFFRRVFPRLMRFRGRLEVPSGCIAELPPLFT